MEYFNVCKEIWTRWVPQRGHAQVLQGELLRQIERLRHEAQKPRLDLRPDGGGSQPGNALKNSRQRQKCQSAAHRGEQHGGEGHPAVCGDLLGEGAGDGGEHRQLRHHKGKARRRGHGIAHGGSDGKACKRRQHADAKAPYRAEQAAAQQHGQVHGQPLHAALRPRRHVHQLRQQHGEGDDARRQHRLDGELAADAYVFTGEDRFDHLCFLLFI